LEDQLETARLCSEHVPGRLRLGIARRYGPNVLRW